MPRITDVEIEGAIELFVNSIYDNGLESDWTQASLQTWVDAVYEELVTWKTDGEGSYWHSNENRFVGKERIIKRITPMIEKRLQELEEEGYQIKAIH